MKAWLIDLCPGGLPVFVEFFIVVYLIDRGRRSVLPGTDSIRHWAAPAAQQLLGLQFKTMLPAEDNGKQKGKKKGKESAFRIVQGSISPSYVEQMPLFGLLKWMYFARQVLCYAGGVHLVWQAVVRAHVLVVDKDPWAGTVTPGIADAAALTLLSVTLLAYFCTGWTAGRQNDFGGFVATWAGIIGGLACLAMLNAEEESPLLVDFEIPAKHAELELACSILQRRANVATPLTWAQLAVTKLLPGLTAWNALLSLACGTVAFGTVGTTWRALRCHYQMCERLEGELRDGEQRRAQAHLEWHMKRCNGEDPGKIPGVGGQMYIVKFWTLTRVSFASLLLPFLLAALYSRPAVAALGLPADWLPTARLLVALVWVTARFKILQEYIQVYLLRDPVESLRHTGDDADELALAKAMAQRHHTALQLAARTALMLSAPACLLLSLSYLTLRIAPPPTHVDQALQLAGRYAAEAANVTTTWLNTSDPQMVQVLPPLPRGLFLNSAQWLLCWAALCEAAALTVCLVARWVLNIGGPLVRSWLRSRRDSD
eukprot:TRINITY_DN56097_c0_g1_i1.p1 TRINITY_DN56097_c0_g1~~TRINITY_DN56097_c0_g1_i1.p1  ORF type:complete len:571 (+),score=199.52 TRINITY_DN56097_c0_g1_i1:88-1713(+)